MRLNLIALALATCAAQGQIRIAFHNGTTTLAGMTGRPAGSVVNTSASTWNNVANSGGVGLVFSSFVLQDPSGTDSGARLAASSGFSAYNSNGWETGTQDKVMMEGWYGFRAGESITVSNLPASYAQGFSVIVYGDSNSTSRTMNYTIGGQTKTIQDTGTFAGTFTENTNHVVFSGLTGTSFVLTGNPGAADARSAVNGIVIMPLRIPAPPVIQSFTVNDSYVSPGTSVTLSWNVTGATGISISPQPGPVTGDSGSVTVTPSQTTTYTLAATNGDGSRTATLRAGVGPPRPNIVLMLVDDFGITDLSVPFVLDASGVPVSRNFNSFYQTPHMASLAASGMRFTSAYAQSVCSPTRCGLLSGRNSARHAVTDWVGASTSGSPTNWRSSGFNGAETTLPKLLQSAGYRTIHVGKAHFSNASTTVESMGFDRNIAGFHWGHPWQGYMGVPAYGGMPGMEAYDGTMFLTKALGIEANRLIGEAVSDGAPFFLNMSFYATHSPFTTDPDATGNYGAAVSPDHQKFATMVEGVDRVIGSIRQKLVDLGVAENTLIVFLGDNGSDSPATTVDGLASGAFSDFPLRGKKGSKWEGGSRVPIIATWAASAPANPFQQALPVLANSIETDMVASWDIPVTLLHAAGGAGAAGFGEDGHDLSPYLAGLPGHHRPQELVIHYPHAHRSNYFSWIRQENLKLIYNYQGNTWQLYDLAADPVEATNLASSQPQTVTRMARALARRLAFTWGTQGPLIPTAATSAPNGNVVSIPDNPAVDVDADGIPDNQEDPDLDGLADPGETDPDNDNTDGDLTRDGDELRAGTDPLSASSFFRAVPEISGGNLVLRWPSAPGGLFRIESSESLNPANWQVVIDNLAASSGTQTSHNLGQPTSAPRKFYRIGLK